MLAHARKNPLSPTGGEGRGEGADAGRGASHPHPAAAAAAATLSRGAGEGRSSMALEVDAAQLFAKALAGFDRAAKIVLAEDVGIDRP